MVQICLYTFTASKLQQVVPGPGHPGQARDSRWRSESTATSESISNANISFCTGRNMFDGILVGTVQVGKLPVNTVTVTEATCQWPGNFKAWQ